MKQIAYLTNPVVGSAVGGRTQLSSLHSQVLHELMGDGFDRIELVGEAGGKKLLGFVDGVSPSSIDCVISKLRRSGARQVFLDGSNLGRMARGIKRALPEVKVFTFFHNCEARFFLGAFRQNKSVRSLGVLVANYLAERCAVNYSDKLICLNDRDSRQLLSLYGRRGTHISAMGLRDCLPNPSDDGDRPPSKRYALFVGGTFYANQAGIAWFAENVAPYVAIRTCVVGKGFEALKEQFAQYENIEIVGSVDDLAPWYSEAHFIVAPIFDGSGMKTKVAEALMFGKRVIGTTEAFAGYEDIVKDVGLTCKSPREFIDAVQAEALHDFVRRDASLRAIYVSRYSPSAVRDRLAEILEIE